MQAPRRSALTLIELLVVVAIIAVLCGLLLPAILQARSAGRRAQCGNNLAQLAKAVQSFDQRMNRLPVYWGPMKGGIGEVFGGWLVHLLPDLDQQPTYDLLQPSGSLVISTTVTTGTEWRDTVTYIATGRKIPAVPASPDYQPASIGSGTATDSAGNQYTYPIVQEQIGYPAEPERDEYMAVVTGSVAVPFTITSSSPVYGWVHNAYDTTTSRLTLPVLTDVEDVSRLRAPSRPTTPSGYDDAPLTNYQMNAHVLTKFNGARWIIDASGTAVRSGNTVVAITGTSDPKAQWGGYFPAPLPAAPSGFAVSGTWSHLSSGSCGPVGRTFDHVTDGLSNTLLMAEGMRQCDAEQTFRYAFLPAGPTGTSSLFNEHAFGILPNLRSGTSGTAAYTRAPIDAYGNTLMFQTRPRPIECNPARLQALHGEFLMTALCDGSVRAVSSLVSRREPTGAAASGRERFLSPGQFLGDANARGGVPSRWDGVWDQLMQPADGQVLSNTGEVGRESAPSDPPL